MIPDIVIKIQNELSAIEDVYKKKKDEGTINEYEKNYLMGIIHTEQIIESVCRESEKTEMDMNETALNRLKKE